jgi:hypothetical protein
VCGRKYLWKDRVKPRKLELGFETEYEVGVLIINRVEICFDKAADRSVGTSAWRNGENIIKLNIRSRNIDSNLVLEYMMRMSYHLNGVLGLLC